MHLQETVSISVYRKVCVLIFVIILQSFIQLWDRIHKDIFHNLRFVSVLRIRYLRTAYDSATLYAQKVTIYAVVGIHSIMVTEFFKELDGSCFIPFTAENSF